VLFVFGLFYIMYHIFHLFSFHTKNVFASHKVASHLLHSLHSVLQSWRAVTVVIV